MAKKLNFGNISAETLSVLNKWNKADIFGADRRATAKTQVNAAQEQVDTIKRLRDEAVAGGMSVDDAIRAFPMREAMATLENAKDGYNAVCKAIREEQNEAKALIPENMYQAYVVRNISGDSTEFCAQVREFLVSIGLEAPAVASAKFADIIASRIGRRKASGKAKKEGHKTSDLTKASFADMFIREFLEFCINEKGVLDQLEDGTLKMHDFSADSDRNQYGDTYSEKGKSTTEGAEAQNADAKAMFRQLMKELHPDNTGVDNSDIREFMFRAVQNRDNAEQLNKILEEVRAYFAQNQKEAA